MSYNIQNLKIYFIKQLIHLYNQQELNVFFTIFCKQEFNFEKEDILLNYNAQVNDIQFDKLNNVIERLNKSEPIQYIYGVTQFCGLEFNVDKNVLIPRPETEELVETIIKKNKKSDLKILDIGTGSGCIAISLSKYLSKAKVDATDISHQAIKIAQKNAALNNISVNFFQQDILNTHSLSDSYDLIVSNPPYVRNLEKKEMQKNVLEHEPHLALFVEDDNPLLYYDKISKLAKNHLKTDGKLYLEINQYIGNQTLKLIQKNGFEKAILKKDFLGNDRFIIALQ